MNKVFKSIVRPFAIAYLVLEEFITGKPDLLLNVSKKVEVTLATKTVMIDVSSQAKNTDWKTYFITELKRRPFPADVNKVTKALGISNKSVDVLLKDKRLTVAISKNGLGQIQNEINKKPNIFQKILKKARD